MLMTVFVILKLTPMPAAGLVLGNAGETVALVGLLVRLCLSSVFHNCEMNWHLSECVDAPDNANDPDFCKRKAPNKCHKSWVARQCPKSCWLCTGNYRGYDGIYDNGL